MPLPHTTTASHQRDWPSLLWTCALTCGLGGLVLTTLVSHLLYNTTPSLPRGWYWYTPRLTEIPLQRGDLVLLTPPAWVQDTLRRLAPHLDGRRPWMKTIAAIAGDIVCLEGDQVTINGSWRGSRPLLQAYPLQPVGGCLTVPAATYFVMSAHPRSFDGRYIGVVPRAVIHGTVTALYTWEGRL